MALILGLELLAKESGVGRVSMVADNMGAIVWSHDSRVASSQQLWEMFRKQWKRTKAWFRNIKLNVRWVPGHMGIKGNEEADWLAKKAIEKGSSPTHWLPGVLCKGLPGSIGACTQRINDRVKKRAKCMWSSSPRAARMKYIDKSMPSNKFLGLTENLSRHKASLLIQLRTEHIPLQNYLYRIGKAGSPTCEHCGRERETVQHFLMQCPAFKKQCRELVAQAGPDARKRGLLLSAKGMIRHLLTYVADIGQFGQVMDERAGVDSGGEDTQGRLGEANRGDESHHGRRTQ